ncbi:MAG: phosphatidate cytidylyltransferase [Chloroflexota bacterium]
MSQNFLARYLTALILIPVVIVTMYTGGIIWSALVAALAILGGLEFYGLAHGRAIQGYAAIGMPAIILLLAGFHLAEPLLTAAAVIGVVIAATPTVLVRHASPWRIITTLAGIVYVGLPAAFLIGMRQLDNGFLWLVVIVAITWGTDTFAYFGGRVWGRRKLAPRLSPNKTLEGAVVGLAGGFLPALLFLFVTGSVTTASLVMIAFGPIVAILGDLLESAIKRFFKVKDSHLAGLNIIPGHGGVLDRVDALLMVVMICYPYILLTGIAS